MSESLRCPVETCTGFVCEVDDFWGCGECGNVWKDRKSLDQAITQIVKKRAYRAGCYRRRGAEGWAAVSAENEPKDYEALVQREWDEA
jgi:Zn-finger nucleic acid-binding protein